MRAYETMPAANPLKKRLADQVALLRKWDYRWAAGSVPTSLAVLWAEDLSQKVSPERATPQQRIDALASVSDKLVADFGRWQTPWGDINRFQRLTDDIVQPFDDAGPNIPVPFTSNRWGSLASFGARAFRGSKKIYGTTGNSFLAIVEFGDEVSAKAVTAGGQSGDPRSPHFNDQATRYASGDLRDVYFYPDELKSHTEREYHPGH